MEEKSVFSTLNQVDCHDHLEKKDGLTYLSWTWAWAETMKRFPDAKYEIVKYDGLPYVSDPKTGIMCFTRVTIGGDTREMWLPVMDGKNKAMRFEPYSYKVRDRRTGQYVDAWVQAATMFDINKTIMRCLTKNLAMFGLGLYVYAGEDLPEVPADNETRPAGTDPTSYGAQQSAPAPVAYQPYDTETYWKFVKAHAFGETCKSGASLRTYWIKQTHAGPKEIAAFDHDVENVKLANNLK